MGVFLPCMHLHAPTSIRLLAFIDLHTLSLQRSAVSTLWVQGGRQAVASALQQLLNPMVATALQQLDHSSSQTGASPHQQVGRLGATRQLMGAAAGACRLTLQSVCAGLRHQGPSIQCRLSRCCCCCCRSCW